MVSKLDSKNKKGSTLPLFHFLDDNAKPWSKRCGLVVFNLRNNNLHVYCLKFKSGSIPPHDVPDQLKVSVDWHNALHATLNAYTTKRSAIHATKYVLSNHPNPTPYLDADGKYSQRNHTIRHCRYANPDGIALADLEKSNIEVIR